MFEKCGNCGSRVIRGITDTTGTYCSAVCLAFAAYPDFCERCKAASINVSSGGTATINGIGTKLYGNGDPCPTCNSVIKRKFFCFVFIPLIPLIPLGKYRVKNAKPTRFSQGRS